MVTRRSRQPNKTTLSESSGKIQQNKTPELSDKVVLFGCLLLLVTIL
jgi:hypothetical protein